MLIIKIAIVALLYIARVFIEKIRITDNTPQKKENQCGFYLFLKQRVFNYRLSIENLKTLPL